MDKKIKLVVEYDRHQRVWCSYLVDDEENVVSNYEYNSTQKEAKEWGEYMINNLQKFLLD